jgi:hypothetical protein
MVPLGGREELGYEHVLLPNLRLATDETTHFVADILGVRTQAPSDLRCQHTFGREANGKTYAQLCWPAIEHAVPLKFVNERRGCVVLAQLAVSERPRRVFASDVRRCRSDFRVIC